MQKLLFFPLYIRWHYHEGIKEFVSNGKSLISFLFHFFSIPVLLRTLFVPWKRLSENYTKTFDPGDLFGTFVTNTILRVVGAIMRIIVMLCGIVSTGVFAALVFCGFLIWILLPIVVAFLVGLSLSLLLQ